MKALVVWIKHFATQFSIKTRVKRWETVTLERLNL